MKNLSWTSVLAVIVALAIGASLPLNDPEPVQTTRYEYVTPQSMQELVRGLTIENAGLRARVEGVHRVEPVVVVQTDTVVMPPDTVLVAARMTAAGDLSLARLTKADTLYAPSIATRSLGNCDDGWSWSAGTFVCDPARFGHLYAFGELYAGNYAGAEGGLLWQPSYRSSWRVEVRAGSDGRFYLGVQRLWRFF